MKCEKIANWSVIIFYPIMLLSWILGFWNPTGGFGIIMMILFWGLVAVNEMERHLKEIRKGIGDD